ncbi:DUF4442 domain-containing protein [Tenacibaculum sp. SG-28]|uniref:DUF4442 domain-containing protein n=1 Tax=Tenacibaculum sp. SG-28 TaxID=754426 RepID=UPI000CF577E0|nr:DUF4442 domain-containing protein [Tenacibaculum sp. SG-28]PQJ19652.1 DUF4442 domain-containing protein [Tenacibaculum sp. SG-28]
MYATITAFLEIFFKKKTIFKYGFNLSPMYRRTTGRISELSADLFFARVKIPISYKNRNYVNSIFGGSLFTATDPIYMIQLMQILGKDYVVWDKAASINYRRPAKKDVYADFSFTKEEIEYIKNRVALENEIDIVKELAITDKNRHDIFATVSKTIYIANKKYYKNKRKKVS